ncbi:hypothetical protein [Nostoc sp. ChiQUE01b]|uniref:hypothetical protein n=1 Tax=Nostoc sp. ChiQUE01b TaxID=3075376 RepID=UPI002AD1D537|nr:hypothetical protein [Nostoc sp. ChiQUE01b]MDZ8256992.1 hypothetical protein [Nostoc sp. ChiQUE01b]
MRLTINKSVYKSVRIWTFLLLLIFKGVFPKPAFAFLSSDVEEISFLSSAERRKSKVKSQAIAHQQQKPHG